MNWETKITIYKFTPQVFTLTLFFHVAGALPPFPLFIANFNGNNNVSRIQKQDYNTPGFPGRFLINFLSHLSSFFYFQKPIGCLVFNIFFFLYICIKGSRQYLLI